MKNRPRKSENSENFKINGNSSIGSQKWKLSRSLTQLIEILRELLGRV
jgi:hypothetical protein